MARSIKTYLFCYDDHRSFTEDVKKRFFDTARYTVISFQTRDEFIDQLKVVKEHNFCKIAILGLHDNEEQQRFISKLKDEVKEIDQRTGLILLCPADILEEIRNTIRYNIDAYIPKNSNSILRIHNTVKKLFSEHSIRIFKKRRNISLYILIAFVLLSALTALIAFFMLPEYF
jgi:DNA-binding NarL/FixJ family response regulator